MRATVVIPFYNAESTLKRAVDSVLVQEVVSLQILLIDNNSSDNSRKIAEVFANDHENVSLYSESNQGVNNARNLGLSLADFEWIQYLDADDELLPRKIFNQLSIPSIDKIDLICSPITEHTENGTVIEYNFSEMNDIWLSLLEGKIGWTCSNLWRTSALRAVGGWNKDYTSHQEKELMARMIIEGKRFHFFDQSECIVYEQSASISKRVDFPLTGIKFMLFLKQYFQNNNQFNSKRKSALHNQLYHKYLMAYKINPKEALDAMYNTNLDSEIINLPLHHRVLINIIGIKNTFGILRFLSRK